MRMVGAGQWTIAIVTVQIGTWLLRAHACHTLIYVWRDLCTHAKNRPRAMLEFYITLDRSCGLACRCVYSASPRRVNLDGFPSPTYSHIPTQPLHDWHMYSTHRCQCHYFYHDHYRWEPVINISMVSIPICVHANHHLIPFHCTAGCWEAQAWSTLCLRRAT